MRGIDVKLTRLLKKNSVVLFLLGGDDSDLYSDQNSLSSIIVGFNVF